jgi:hypothetical protein
MGGESSRSGSDPVYGGEFSHVDYKTISDPGFL